MAAFYAKQHHYNHECVVKTLSKDFILISTRIVKKAHTCMLQVYGTHWISTDGESIVATKKKKISIFHKDFTKKKVPPIIDWILYFFCRIFDLSLFSLFPSVIQVFETSESNYVKGKFGWMNSKT